MHSASNDNKEGKIIDTNKAKQNKTEECAIIGVQTHIYTLF